MRSEDLCDLPTWYVWSPGDGWEDARTYVCQCPEEALRRECQNELESVGDYVYELVILHEGGVPEKPSPDSNPESWDAWEAEALGRGVAYGCARSSGEWVFTPKRLNEQG